MKTRKKHLAHWLTLAVLGISLSACVSTQAKSQSADTQSKLSPTDTPSQLSPEENAAQFAAQSQRLHAMLPELRKQQPTGDFLVSETGISKLLHAASLGAEGETLTQIRRFIGDKPIVQVNDSIYTNANLVYFADQRAINKSYIKALSDFVIEKTIKAMNAKITKLTKGLVEGDLSSELAKEPVILVNVMAFEGKWLSPFRVANTKNKTFNARCGAQTQVGKVPTMHTRLKTHYIASEGIHAVSVPFVKGYHLLLAMSKDKTASATAASDWLLRNKGKHINYLLGNSRERVDLALPKLALTSGFNLVPVMRALGVTDLFSQRRANLSKISGSPLYVSQFKQDAKLIVNEKGAKAAAVTKMVLSTPSLPRRPVAFHVDHPFAFAIVRADNPRQIVLAGEINSLGICKP